MLVLLLKAKVPGGALAPDLFAAPVDVHGYVTKQGVYVAPHHAIRHKRPEQPSAPAQLGLFCAPKKPVQRAPARPAPEAQPDLFAPATPKPAPAAPASEPKVEPEAEPAPEPPAPMAAHLPRAESTPVRVAEWGVPQNATKRERRRLNLEAIKILDAKSDDEMTAEDRQALARYTGRGGIGDSLNEFYTPPAVASSMWSMLANAGFRGGDVLEPSSGTGVFLHTAPEGSRVTAVELDPTSARIAGILHRPAGHEVRTSSLEMFATTDGRLFDAVIGNVPFGLRGSAIKDDKRDFATAETYFLDTALDKAKDGGLVALIVPTGIMDSRTNRRFREDLVRKGEFLGAWRLPNTAFKSSHTGVTTDVVLFRKRPQEIAGALGAAATRENLETLGIWDPEFVSGAYFEGRGAGNVMGRMEEGWRAKAGMGHDITVSGDMHGVPEALAKAELETPAASPSMQQILELWPEDPDQQRKAVTGASKPAYQVARVGDVKVIDGFRYVLQGEPPRWHRAEEDLPEAVRDARAISDLLEELPNAKDPAFTRTKLIEALDEFVKQHGVPGRNKKLLAWIDNPSLGLEEGEELHEHGARVAETGRRLARVLGTVSDSGEYSGLVTGKMEQKREATLDTVATKLALETGNFTVDQLEAAWGHGDRNAVLDHLFASPQYAVLPDGQHWTTMDAYIAGDLWQALDAARAAAAHEGVAPEYRAKYEAQAQALEEAIQPQSLEDVEVMINSGFIAPEIISAWFEGRREAWQEENTNSPYDGPGLVDVSFKDGIWTFKPVKIQGSRYTFLPPDADLIEKYLNRKGVKKDDLPRIERLNQAFRDWLLASQYRDQVEEHYNRTYRGYRAPAYSDAPIAIPDLNPALDVNAYHYAGVRWAIAAGKGIIAADVGLGKTGRGLMLARIAKSTGQARKPTFVVPKSVLANWVKEAELWFPGSKVLVIGETYSTDKDGNVTSKPDDEATRRRKYHELQQNEYDFVFISQPTWNDLDVDPITKGQYANSDFWVQRGDQMGNAGDKRLNKIRETYNQALAKRGFQKREDTIYFNDLGIDMLLLDEGHAYKNLYAARSRFGENPKFLGGSGLSNRAQDTYFKTRNLRERNGGRGVYMLTATPTKNSPLEIYSMLSHIAPEAFERMGIKNSEEFLDRFCVFERDNILGVNGEIQEALVTAGFKNMDELRAVMRRYIDRKTAEDVGLQLPKKDVREHFVDMSDKQEEVYQALRQAAEESAKSKDATGDSHIFSIMDKMGKASIDLELLGYAGEPSPKIEAAAKQIVDGAKEGGQVVFIDHIDVHPKIVKALAAAGIPEKQIGVINAKVAASSAARQKICDDFNAGKLKVVIGNTPTMGEGVNLQKGTTDIHHLDLPWEPASVQQRNGRGLRQGNKREAVRIHTYIAKKSFDAYRWQTILAKRDWQDELWNGGDRVENLARQGGMSRSEMMIMLSADPEAARAKYESDKAAAEERKTAEGRGRANEAFVKFQLMTRNLAKLEAKAKAEDRRPSGAMERLAHSIRKMRDQLRDNAYFQHKAVLDSKEPVVLEPVSGHLWKAGTGMEIAGGLGNGPIYVSDEPTKWVVESVDPEANTVTVRPHGTQGWPRTLKADELQNGATPFAYSKEADDKEELE